MKNLIYKILVASVAVFLACSFTACGDDDSGSVTRIENPDDENESSSSSVKKSSSSTKKKSSSSSEKVSSSSEKSRMDGSSNSKKASSSSKGGSAKNSSSSAESSSSSSFDIYGGRNPGDLNSVTCVTEGLIIASYDSKKRERIEKICQDGLWVLLESSSSSSGYFHYSLSERLNSDVEYTEVKDSDGNTYEAVNFVGFSEESDDEDGEVKIDFLAENLNIGMQVTKDMDQMDFDDSKIEKYCYGDDPYFCENGFGGLYTWSEAMGFSKACNFNELGSAQCPETFNVDPDKEINWDTLQHQGICPNGWHIMNKSEWIILSRGSEYVGDMVSADFGNGNIDGLSLMPSGLLDFASGEPDYALMGDWGYLWLPREDVPTKAFTIKFTTRKWFPYDKVALKTDALAVRCVKNHK